MMRRQVCHPCNRRRDAGITLLEIMIVIAIIALIVGLAAPRLMGSYGRAKAQAAEMQMTNLKSALRLYQRPGGASGR